MSDIQQGEPIPSGVYYKRTHNDFIDATTMGPMGDEFHGRWVERADEFPQSSMAARSRIAAKAAEVVGVPIRPSPAVGEPLQGFIERGGTVSDYVEAGRADPAHHNPVDHPRHYNSHPSGVECIEVTEHFNFNMGNAIKYIWRTDEKDDPIEQLRKAAWYIAREIERRTKPTAR